MKKLLLLLVSFWAITSCEKAPESLTEALIGTWNLETMQKSGSAIVDLENEGKSFKLTFNTDGTWTEVSSGIEISLKDDGIFQVEEEDNTIRFMQDESIISWKMEVFNSKKLVTKENVEESETIEYSFSRVR